MSTRNLSAVFAPKSIALIGASSRERSVGGVVVGNVLRGGFAGAIYLVNPRHRHVFGLPCYSRIGALPEPPDLAVVMTPASTVPGVIARLGERGTKAAAILSAGINADLTLKHRILAAAKRFGLRLIGPNSLGVFAPHTRLNASFAHMAPVAGDIGLLSQSGAIASAMIDWAAAESIGFSHVISLGDMLDVDAADCLDMLASDPKTRSILLYLETVSQPRKFLSAARAAARLKPVIVLKPGRHAEAAAAAATHTGALAGADKVIDAAFRRAGILRVDSLPDLFTAAEVTARCPPMLAVRTAIVTNGGGAGVLAVDHLLDNGMKLAALEPQTLAALNRKLPASWSHANPVDIIGDAPPERFRDAVQAIAADPGVDAVLVMNCPTALASPMDTAKAVATMSSDGRVQGKPVLTCWLGEASAGKARQLLSASGFASFATPIEAARGVAMLTRWSQAQANLARVPLGEPEPKFDRAAIRAVLHGAAREKRGLLTETESKAVLTACGIPTVATLQARNAEEVAGRAAELLRSCDAVVVKLLSRTVSHKSDVGGVALDVPTAEAARAAAESMSSRIAAQLGPDIVDGFTVQPMVDRQDALELIAGLATDPGFGPIVLFGEGGTGTEAINDTSIDLVPLDAVLARDLIERTRIALRIHGYRGRNPADIASIAKALTGLGQLAVEFGCIRSVDINPLLASDKGVIALDARIEIDPDAVRHRGANPALAIRPYPAQWASQQNVGGNIFEIRPIRPSDAALYPAFLASTSADDLFLRFHEHLSRMPEPMLLRLTQLDYDREMAFVAIEQASGRLAGVVRMAADRDRVTAEFAALVRSDLQGQGLGTALMHQLIDYARAEGVSALTGTVLRQNTAMLALCAALGFTALPEQGDQDCVAVKLSLVRAAGSKRQRRTLFAEPAQ